MSYAETCPECDSADNAVVPTTEESAGLNTVLLQCNDCGAAWDTVPGQPSHGGGQVQLAPRKKDS